MELLPLDRLPQYSEWASYLLDPNRDPPGELDAYTDIDVYDTIYGHVLEHYRDTGLDRETFSLETRAKGREEPDVISIDESLYLASTNDLVALEKDAVRETLRPVLDGGETVVALGCGWGRNLGIIADSFPDVTVVGGEIAEQGVTISRELHADENRISVKTFDFHGDWSIFDGHDDVVVFTYGALTTLDGVQSVIDRLVSHAEKRSIVGVHLEQTVPHPSNTVLGLLRRRYADVRGFETDLLPVLRAHPDVSVTYTEYDAVGANPLHPQTAIRWYPSR
ncbi:methyltransferase domain-containing protein [Haladaptatus caseinilyticus]|uniref:class I SAM-dependent methyltransferase n=1 Tax=Haladaptatus caseinilyticus TaxID=2993314 RepID=UPI00224B9979|nr:class I SAM-dependent methyltransferase [Haladaptatus caseinilyticus]